MNLIQRLKIWTELRRLETRAHQSPSPSTFVDLGQVYINLGMHEKTLVLAEEGLALFPQSVELRKLKRFAQKKQLTERIGSMRVRLARSKDATLYHELAHLHLELGDFESVQGVCEECIRRFPEDAESHLLLARANLLGFYRDLGAREGSAAVEHLRAVLRLDGDVVAARRLLAELSWRIGAQISVLEHVDALGRLGVRDAELQAMRETVAQSSPAGADGDYEDIAALLHDVESRGRLTRQPVSRERRAMQDATSDDGDELHGVRDRLARLADAPGVRKATFIRGAKALVRGEIRDGRDPFLRVTRVVARAAQRAAKRMDVGNFSKGTVDGNFGRICVCSYGESIAALECTADTDVTALLDELQELVAQSLVSASRRGA
ncbi:MAG: hypothetical protein IPM29_22485 [Planctomycetes bacterium]|nr:hypothetical protein [Planctomycetota bacterium]